MNEFVQSELGDCNAQENSVPDRKSPEMFGTIEDDNDITDNDLTQLMDTLEMKLSNETTPFKAGLPIMVPPPKKGRYEKSHAIPVKLVFTKSFKLLKIYERFYNHPPINSHRAEDDAITLLKCALFCKQAFIKKIPDYVKPLHDFI